MTSYNVDEPIYAPATAYAPSALAVIRLSGRNTIEMLSHAFSSPSRLKKAASKTLVHGYILDEGDVRIDEVVLAVYREGSGYTGEEAAEISCHGSLVVLRRLFSRLEQLGFKRAEKGEFTFRAFMHGRMDLTQAEAVEEIIRSKSEKSQEKALDRLSGKLRDSLTDIKTRLVDILASLEVQLDYAEDEIIDEWMFPEAEVSSIISSLKALSSTYGASRIYREGAKVVLAGAANAGKSSLFNLLVKEDRAIVSPVPGTTRDFIETWIDLDGIPVRLFDTAGLRSSDDVVESEGIRRSEALMDDADLIIYLVDPDDALLPEDIDSDRTLVVYSKRDKRRMADDLSISSVTGEGVSELISEVKERLVGLSPQEEGGLSIDSERQYSYLLACIDALESAERCKDAPVDIMAMFFQSALESLGYITGEVTTEDLLDTLFSKFCLGK